MTALFPTLLHQCRHRREDQKGVTSELMLQFNVVPRARRSDPWSMNSRAGGGCVMIRKVEGVVNGV